MEEQNKEQMLNTAEFYEQTYSKLAGEVKAAFKGKEWFSLSNLHKVSKMRHDEIRDILGILVTGGLAEHDRKENRYRIVTNKEARQKLIAANIERIDQQIAGLNASREMIRNWLELISKPIGC